MTHDYVSVRRQGRVAIVTFDRGNPLNALSLQAIEELTDVARNLESDLEVSAIVVTTPAGSGFSAGRDLADPAMDLRRKLPMLERRRVAGAGKRLCAAWESIEAITHRGDRTVRDRRRPRACACVRPARHGAGRAYPGTGGIARSLDELGLDSATGQLGRPGAHQADPVSRARPGHRRRSPRLGSGRRPSSPTARPRPMPVRWRTARRPCRRCRCA